MKVTYHAQLFDTIQLDVYDSYMLLPDRHVGRAEIRLIQLDGMPETFTSFYEIWDKKLSSGGSSHAVRKATMSTNVGALQAKITYQFQTINSAFDDDNNDTSGISKFTSSSDGSPDAIAFRRHLQRDRDSPSIHFRKYEEGAQDNNSNTDHGDHHQHQQQHSDSDSSLHPPSPLENEDFPDDSDSDPSDETNTKYSSTLSFSVKRANSIKSGTIPPSTPTTRTSLPPTNQQHQKASKTTMLDSVGYWFGVSSSQETPSSSQPSMHDLPTTLPVDRTQQTKSTSVDILNDMNDSLKTYPLLDTIGSWTVSKETNQILRAIGKLLAAFVSTSLQGYRL